MILASDSKCLIRLDAQDVRATIIRVGRGRFKILKDDLNGKYVGKIIDAGDIIHCRADI